MIKGKNAEDITSIIGRGSMKRHKALGALCDKEIPLKVIKKLLRGLQ